MNRRAFLAWMVAGVSAVVAAPALSRLDLLAAPVEVLAIDPTVPLWVLKDRQAGIAIRFIKQWDIERDTTIYPRLYGPGASSYRKL